jgi:hypothetical protein
VDSCEFHESVSLFETMLAEGDHLRCHQSTPFVVFEAWQLYTVLNACGSAGQCVSRAMFIRQHITRSFIPSLK